MFVLLGLKNFLVYFTGCYAIGGNRITVSFTESGPAIQSKICSRHCVLSTIIQCCDVFRTETAEHQEHAVVVRKAYLYFVHDKRVVHSDITLTTIATISAIDING